MHEEEYAYEFLRKAFKTCAKQHDTYPFEINIGVLDPLLIEYQIEYLEAHRNLLYCNHYGIMVHTGEDAGGPWEYHVRMTMDQFSKNVLYRDNYEHFDTRW